MTVTESLLTTDEQRVSDLVTELLETYPPATTDSVTFLGAQFDAGLAWVQFPVGHGGLGLNARTLLADNDAHAFFRALGDQVVTGPTLTNVNDFRAILVERR